MDAHTPNIESTFKDLAGAAAKELRVSKKAGAATANLAFYFDNVIIKGILLDIGTLDTKYWDRLATVMDEFDHVASEETRLFWIIGLGGTINAAAAYGPDLIHESDVIARLIRLYDAIEFAR